MPIELTTADASTINSIRETLSAAETFKLEAPKSDSRSISNGEGEFDTTVLFLSALGTGPEGSLGKITVTFPPTDGLYQRQLLRRLRRKYDGNNDFPYNYSNVKLTVNPGEGEIVTNVIGMDWGNDDVYDIYVDQTPTSDPYIVNYIEFEYDFVNTVGLDVENSIFGMATDDNDIDIISGRDIDLEAADDVYISAGSNFELEHNRLDGQDEEDGIELITNNADNQYRWTFNFLGDLNVPGNIRFNKSYTQSSSILSHPLSSGDGNGYTTLELHPDATRSSSDQYLIIDPTGGTPPHIHIRAGGQQDNSSAELIVGGETGHVKIGAGVNPSVTVKSNNHDFIFNASGNVILPSNGNVTFSTNPVTAYSVRIVGVPSQSTGNTGDKQGDIALDSNYIYYCIEDYGGTQYNVVHDLLGGSADGVNNGYLVLDSYQLPQVGWQVTYNGSTAIINQVNNGGTPGYYIVFVDTPLVIPGQASFTWGPVPSTDIWKRVNFTNDTW